MLWHTKIYPSCSCSISPLCDIWSEQQRILSKLTKTSHPPSFPTWHNSAFSPELQQGKMKVRGTLVIINKDLVWHFHVYWRVKVTSRPLRVSLIFFFLTTRKLIWWWLYWIDIKKTFQIYLFPGSDMSESDWAWFVTEIFSPWVNQE